MQASPATVFRLATVFLSAIVICACNNQSSEILGQAYVAPQTLNLRRELNQKNGTVAVLKHGEQVGIVDVRRRFVKIRTKSGQEGWVDSLQLLSPEQMDAMRKQTEQALAFPSEGSASVYEALNVHIEPNRTSPAFARIPEGGSVAVLGHRVVPRTAGSDRRPNLILERPEPPSRRKKEERQARNRSRLPAPPPPPKPPANWQELSTERVDGMESTFEQQQAEKKRQAAAAALKAAEPKKPVVLEDWSLVRTKDKQCGWVLSRNLVMSIPDEVAQYAEGKRISSYFDLGSVPDEEKGTKHNWLWTTSSAIQSFDYDAWRVFLWNRRRHRYETSYRQRDVEGYFPVQVEPPDASPAGRVFHLIMKDDDGKFRRRTYLFDGVRVHLTGTEYYTPGQAAPAGKSNGLDTDRLSAKLPAQAWLWRQWANLKRTMKGIL
jgi:SH3-like domain-containing protein